MIIAQEKDLTLIGDLKNLRMLVFVSVLKDIRRGCKHTVLYEPLLKNQNLNCHVFERRTRQPYNDNLCFFSSCFTFAWQLYVLNLTTTKGLICQSLDAHYQFWPIFVYKVQQTQNFTLLLKRTNINWKEFKNIWLVDGP